MDTEYLTVADVAKRLKVTRQAVYNWLNEGRLKAVRVGSHLRIPVSALVEFMQPYQPGEHTEETEPGQLVGALA